LREILLNAVMHRDYSDPGSFTSVAIFDDRIEICSIGKLLSGVTIDGLSGEHPSKLRNPLIAETFHRTGAVEIWGRGTNRVIDECRKRGLEPPSFEERFGALIVTFRAAIGLSVAGVLGPAPVELGRRAQRILALLRERKELTSAELLTLLGDPITQRYLQKELRALQAGGFVIASGRGRGTAYRLGPRAP
jgi:ATP-dependent DNA helicase RecG